MSSSTDNRPDHLDTLDAESATLLADRLNKIVRLEDIPESEPQSDIEAMHHALGTKLHAEDTALAAKLADKQIELLQNQFNHSLRTSIGKTANMSTYLQFRDIDGGMPLTCALHYFVAGAHLPPSEREILAPLEA
jgi:Terpene synthase family 2, C-terminal metal binding